MIIFPCFTVFILLLLFVRYKRSKAEKKEQVIQETFFEQENLANNTRKQDISNLDYIRLPLERFPVGRFLAPEISDCEAILTELSEKKILNLTGQTNTQLKLQYGPANLQALMEYDENYTLLAKTLVRYAKGLLEQNAKDSAIAVLEFGIECHTDIRENYLLLAGLYQERGQKDEIRSLLSLVQESGFLNKNTLTEKLNAML